MPKKSGDPIPSRPDAKCKCNRYPGCTRHKAQGGNDCEANLETGLDAGSQAGGSWEQGDPILSEQDPDPATTADLIRVSGWTSDQRGITTTAQKPTNRNAKAQMFLLHLCTTDKLQSNHYEFKKISILNVCCLKYQYPSLPE